MIIVCTGNEADKSSLKKVKKIVISTYYQDMEGKRIAVLNQFLPSMKLHHKFIEGDIDKKMFYKKYSKNILENEELYATLILLMQLYAKEKDLCFVCHEDEMEVGYMKFLCDILEKIFNIEYCSYKKWKKKGKKLGKCRINIEKLNKETKKYRDILFGDEYTKKKKNKKK